VERPRDEQLKSEPEVHLSQGLLQLPLVAIWIIALLFLTLPSPFDDRDLFDAADTLVPLQSLRRTELLPSPWSPSLRGCCGAPAHFLWVVPDAASLIAGSTISTRVVALDAHGRRAKFSACSRLHVDLGLAGYARLSEGTSPPTWHRAEVPLDIESDFAGLLEAELRIERPHPAADAVRLASQIPFASGPVHRFSIHARHKGSDNASASFQQGLSRSTWPVGSLLEVVVSAHDRFGNPARTVAGAGTGRRPAEFEDHPGPLMVLRSDRAVELMDESQNASIGTAAESGAMFELRLSANGEARVVIRCREAGAVALWLEPASGSSQEQRQILANSTKQLLVFEDGITKPTTTSRPAQADRRPLSAVDAKWSNQAQEVREAFQHAWRGYRHHAWGHDELKPLSHQGKDDFGGIGMTIIDSLTSLSLMGLEEELEEALNFVRDELDFGRADAEVSVFELIIRALGGLLGSYTLTGHSVLLERALDLGKRLLPAFNSSSRMPWPKVNLARGHGVASKDPTILSEVGSLQLELRYLAELSGDRRFREVADAAFDAVRSAGMRGLMPVYLTPPGYVPVKVLASKFAVGALADSYYEYLLKQWLQSPGEGRFRNLWLEAVDGMPALVRPRLGTREGAKVMGSAKFQAAPSLKMLEVSAMGEMVWKMDHLSCFAPGMLALGLNTIPEGDLMKNGRNATLWRLAEGLTESCVAMGNATRSGLAPEFTPVQPHPPYRFGKPPREGRHSFLRPETAESLFYMYRFTGDEKYRRWGEQLFHSIISSSRVDAGFASVQDVTVTPTEKLDDMQSFVLAETLKYLYLLFSPADALDLDRYVLNTEGHPLPRGGRRRG